MRNAVVVAAAGLGNLIGSLVGCMYVPLAPFLASSHRQVGMLISAQGFAGFAALVPSGQAVDRWGFLPVLKSAVWCVAAGLVISSASARFDVQILGRLFVGAGASTLFNATMAMILEMFDGPEQARHIGTALSIGSLGELAGPPWAGFALALGSAWALEQPQAMSFLPLLAFLLLFRATLECVRERSDPKAKRLLLDPVGGSGGQSEGESDSFFHRSCVVYARVGARSWVLAAILFCMFGAAGAINCAAVLELHARGHSPTVVGAVSLPAAVLRPLAALVGGALGSTPVRRFLAVALGPVLLGAGLVCLAACFFALPDSAALPLVMATIALAQIAHGIVDAPSIALMGELASRQGCGFGQAVTASELAVTGGLAAGPCLGAWVQRRWGFAALCFVVAALALPASAAAAAVLRPSAEEEAGFGGARVSDGAGSGAGAAGAGASGRAGAEHGARPLA